MYFTLPTKTDTGRNGRPSPALTALETDITEDNTGSLTCLPRPLPNGASARQGRQSQNRFHRQAEASIGEAGDTGLVDELYLVSKIVATRTTARLFRRRPSTVKIDEPDAACAALVTSDKATGEAQG